MNVELPDGRILEGVPDGTTKAEIEAKLREAGEWMVPVTKKGRGLEFTTYEYAGDEDGFGALRTFAGGAGFQLVDEAEAAVRTFVDRHVKTDADGYAMAATEQGPDEGKFMGYEDYMNDIEDSKRAYRKNNPVASYAFEIAGALATGGMGSKAAGMGATAFTSAIRQGGVGAAEGFLYGFGSGRTAEERMSNGGLGLLFGAPLGAAGGAIAKIADPVYRAERALQKADAEIAKRAKVWAESIDEKTPGEIVDMVHTRMAQKALMSLQSSEEAGRKLLEDLPSPAAMEALVADEFGISVQKIRAARKAAGVDIPDYRGADPDELMNAFVGQLKRSEEEALRVMNKHGSDFTATMDTLFAPIKRMATTQVGTRWANTMNRAFVRSLKDADDWRKVSNRIDPVKTFLRQGLADGRIDAVRFQKDLLNAALDDRAAMNRARTFIKDEFGEEMAESFETYMNAKIGLQSRYNRHIDATHEVTPNWFHSQKKGEGAPEGAIKSTFNKNVDEIVSAKKRVRELIPDDDNLTPMEYEPIFDTMDDWADDMVQQINVAEMFRLRPMGRTDLAPKTYVNKKGKTVELDPDDVYKEDMKAIRSGWRAGSVGRAMEEKLAREGYDESSIKNATELMHSVIFEGNKAPHTMIRAMRDLGYSSTIFNPYGAALNVHDVFNGMSAMGFRNALDSFFSNMNINPAELGLTNQYMGEYVKRMKSLSPTAFNKMFGYTDAFAEKAAKWSGFQKVDSWGKKRIMGMAMSEARKEVKKGGFRDRWKYTFSHDEMNQLELDLTRGEVTDLVKEMAMMRLSDIQPITRMQQTKFSLDHPNARILYMLKNFAIRQADFIRQNFFQEINKGNTDKAMRFAARYALYSLGGYAVVNEARQPIKGREPDFSPGNLAKMAGRQAAGVVSMGVIGSSDYAWDKFWDAPVKATAESLVPPLIIPDAVTKDVVNSIRTDKDLSYNTLYALPVIGPTLIKPLMED
jgi:hypothetical protein